MMHLKSVLACVLIVFGLSAAADEAPAMTLDELLAQFGDILVVAVLAQGFLDDALLVPQQVLALVLFNLFAGLRLQLALHLDTASSWRKRPCTASSSGCTPSISSTFCFSL